MSSPLRQLSQAAFFIFLAAAGLHAEIIVEASKVLREKPPGIGGVVINAHGFEFTNNAGGIDFQGDLKAAKIKIVRKLAYPDARFPEGKTIEMFDSTFEAIVKSGAEPIFIQYIRPPGEVKSGNPYLTEEGKPWGTPQSNMIFMIKRYTAAPWNLQTQHWQVGNEADIAIDYYVPPQKYAEIFNSFHAALVKAGLRDRVKLHGPVSANAYYWPSPPKPGEVSYIEYFLEHCADTVDLVDYHTYAGAKDEAGVLIAPHKLDYQFDSARQFAIDPKTNKPKDVYGAAALVAKMKTIKFARPNVGLALTEHNATSFHDSVAAGLWNLAVTHYFLYNPFGQITTQFVYDNFGNQQGGDGCYDDKKQKRPVYWALWIHGNLRGPQVLAASTSGNTMKDGRPWLLVTATRDAASLYIEVINRNTEMVKDHVEAKGAAVAGHATLHQLAKDIRPDKAQSTQLGLPFDYEFPPLSATVLTFPLKK